MKNRVSQKFVELYGEGATLYTSPGRINLIGEHTDYNGGFVFPGAVDKGIVAAIRLNGTDKVRAFALDLNESAEFGLNEQDKPAQSWACYIFGVCREIIKRGGVIGGFDTVFAGDVPLGAGMSSSATLESTFAFALNQLYNLGIEKFELARIGQSTEHNYCGVKCGIMDQFASAMGRQNQAIFLDCKDLSFKYVPLNLTGYKIVIGNTKKKRSLADSKYNERRAQCEEALEQLKIAYPEAECLRDITVEQFEDSKMLIQDEICRMRAEHVVYECDRVLNSVKALNDGDLMAFGRMMTASHISLRDLYEVTGLNLDVMVEESLKIDGCIGSRMTGAGFGGCTVSIVEESAVDEFISTVGKNYTERTGIVPEFYISEAGNGGREITAE